MAFKRTKYYKPMTLSRIMPFGKYKGIRLLYIAQNNPAYLIYLYSKMEDFKIAIPDLNYIKEMVELVDFVEDAPNKKLEWFYYNDNEKPK